MYKLDKLPYEYDALEPYIDTHTLGLHHNKHQQNYLNKLNSLLIKNNYSFKYPIEDIPKHIEEFSLDDRKDILFNFGGVVNHNIYFKSMSPKKEAPNKELLKKINMEYGSLDKFKKVFKDKALSLKGSGYTFLVLENGDLNIMNLQNQDSPYNYKVVPLIGLDMWEHAYYLNYKNMKDVYIDNFFEVMDFSLANKIFNVV